MPARCAPSVFLSIPVPMRQPGVGSQQRRLNVMTHIVGMANITLLNARQTGRLQEIIEALRLVDADCAPLRLTSSAVHLEQHAGRVDFWLDGNEYVVNGSIKANGAGVWWVRRGGSPLMRTA